MNKAKKEFNTVDEWLEFTNSGCCHTDKIAVINTPRNRCIHITRSLFYGVEVVGESIVFISVGADSTMQITVKDNSTAVVKRGNVIGKGESRIVLHGNSKAELTNKAMGWAFGEAELVLKQSSSAYLFDEAKATVRDKAHIIVGQYGSAECRDNSSALDTGTTAQISAIGKDKAMPKITKGSWLIKRKYLLQKKWAERITELAQPHDL